MHHRICTLSFFLIFVLSSSFAQKEIVGRVISAITQEPIPYANVGLQRTNIGTIANVDGSFSLFIPKQYAGDTLHFSALGYSAKKILLSYIQKREIVTISLVEKITWLEEVNIEAKKEKNKNFELGNRSFRGGVLETDTLYAGGSTALLIDPRHEQVQLPVYLQKASLRIFKNNLDTLRFRVRLYSVDSLTGKPSQDILQHSIVKESTMRKGWLDFDLSHLAYSISEPFFITFEQLLDLNDRKSIADGYREFITKYPERLLIDTVLFEGEKQVRMRFTKGGLDLPGTFISIAPNKAEEFSCYVRETSFGEWTKVGGIVTATATLSNQRVAVTKVNNEQTPCEEDTKQCAVERMCRDFMSETGMPGMQLYVSYKKEKPVALNLGYADIKNKVPVTDSTRFRLNSISKSMTSVGILRLAEQGKLDLDKNIQTYLPAFPEKKYPITIRQAASHMAGFRDYNENDLSDYIRREHYNNSTEALFVFENDSLLFEPGTKFSYSTFGWNLLGAIVESVSGKEYLSFMEEAVWSPLGLNNTCGDEINKSIPSRSAFYDVTGTENDLGDLSYKYAGGGLLSNAEDLIRLGNALLNNQYFDAEDRQLLFQTNFLKNGQPTGYGLGWYVGEDKNGHRIWYHVGDSFSSSSHLLIYPDDDLVIAFLGNSQDGVNFDVRVIGELFYEKE